MWHPNRPENKDNLVQQPFIPVRTRWKLIDIVQIYLTERDASDGCLWRFEKVRYTYPLPTYPKYSQSLSDDAGDPPDSPQPVSVPVSLPPSFLSKPNVDMSQNSISPYVDNPVTRINLTRLTSYCSTDYPEVSIFTPTCYSTCLAPHLLGLSD